MSRPVPPPPLQPMPGQGAWPQQQKTSGLAIAALVLGIGAICVPYLGFIAGIVAIVLGVMARKQIRTNPGLKGDGMAITGLVLGIVGFLLWILILVFAASLLSTLIKQCTAHPEACKTNTASPVMSGPATTPLAARSEAAWSATPPRLEWVLRPAAEATAG